MRKPLILTGIAAFCALISASPSASAQTAPGAPGSSQTIPEKDPSAGGKHPAVSRSPTLDTGRSSSLSKRLDKSNGVISPPAGVDPGIQTSAPVPDPNSTPVIHPPSASGGPTKAK